MAIVAAFIKLFKKKGRIRKCPDCGKLPEWECWKVIPDECIELWALRCKDGKHYCSTSYWTFKEQAIYEWNRLCTEVEERRLKCEN